MYWQIGTRRLNLTEHSLVMGILNVTPDSFSDGGLHNAPAQAVQHALNLIEDGADIIDIGGESTRPGAAPVDAREEMARVLPVLEQLKQLRPDILVSIDTMKPETAKAALLAGADIINDVTGFRSPEMIAACRESKCGLIVMHMQGEPRTMQVAPHYDDIIKEVGAFFRDRFDTLTQAGIAAERLCFDPGIGFGKTVGHNVELISRLAELDHCGCALMMALSRKRFLGVLLDSPDDGRAPLATVTATLLSHKKGARVHRVHDVRECKQALYLWEKLCGE